VEPARFVARLIGPFLVVIGLGIELNIPFYTAMIGEAVHSPTLVYFAGLFSLVAGLAILNVHRAWTSDWRVIITIFGWLCLIGGIVRIVLPQFAVSLATKIYSGAIVLVIVAVVALLLGAFLSFHGYRQAK
jgi:hypothetical protein